MRQENEAINLALHRAWEQGRNGTALAPDAASGVVDALRDAGFEIVPTPDDEPLPEPDEICLSVGYGETPLPYMPEGSAARIGEARRTGDWSDVTDADWNAWVNVLRGDVARGIEAPPTQAKIEVELAKVRLEWERLKVARRRLGFEDIDQNPPYGPSLASEMISTWFRSLGDAVEWCEAPLRLRRIDITASVRRPPTVEQQEDFHRRLDAIWGMNGVVGADYSFGVNGSGDPEPMTVQIRFDHYITTVGCEFTPLDLPARPARKAA